MSQYGSQWFRMAGHRKIAVYRMVAGARILPVVPGAISGASDDGRTCTGIHGGQNIPDFTAENLQFLKIFIGPAGKNEKVVSGPGNAWSELMPRHSDVEMRIYILFKCRIVLSTGCFLPLRYPQRFKLDGKTAIGNEAPERQRAIILSILTG